MKGSNGGEGMRGGKGSEGEEWSGVKGRSEGTECEG